VGGKNQANSGEVGWLGRSPITHFFQPIRHHDRAMKTDDKVRALAAIELADALIVDFNNPSSALKGINGVTMEKLLIYLKISERSQQRQAKKLSKAAREREVVAEEPESDANE
jgi:hypothetical protein